MRRLALASLLAAAVLLPAAARAETPTLTLSADGSVHAVPDTAVVTLGVVSEAGTAGEALTKNSADMQKTFDSLKDSGIAERDMATSNFSIDPVLVYPETQDDGTQDPPKVVGYRVANQVTVTLHDVAKTGPLLDAVVKAGANQVQGIAFKVADEDRLLDKARAEAMKTVIARAKVYADAGGFTLGRITAVSEAAVPPPYPAPMAMMKMAADAAPTPIAAGEQTLSVTVTVAFEIH